jgi:hypothetical protein
MLCSGHRIVVARYDRVFYMNHGVADYVNPPRRQFITSPLAFVLWKFNFPVFVLFFHFP